jgi:hypothetical protein
MHLHEEYVKRHKLAVPLIRYDSQSVVLLRSKEKPLFWRVIDITWSPCHWHPGKFVIKTWVPRHDNSRMHRAFPTREVYWDEYEDRVLALRDMGNDFIAVTKKELPLATWYVFLMIYDTYLSRLSEEFKEFVASSIDPDNTELRQAAQRAQVKMCLEDEALKSAYRSHMEIFRNYSDWLVALING